jgi:hypothetical protein
MLGMSGKLVCQRPAGTYLFFSFSSRCSSYLSMIRSNDHLRCLGAYLYPVHDKQLCFFVILRAHP